MTSANTKASISPITDQPIWTKPRKTHIDRLFERGAIDAKVHAMLKKQKANQKASKEADASKIALAAIAKAMKR